MSDVRQSRGVDAAMEDLWGRTLAQIPTVFGKLAYLSSLRDEHSGKYRHYGLAQLYGEEATHQAVNASHELAFSEWVNFSLDKQRSELEAYLDELEEPRADVLDSWVALNPYRSFAPAAAGDAERYLYVSDLEIIVELLQNELSSSS